MATARLKTAASVCTTAVTFAIMASIATAPWPAIAGDAPPPPILLRVEVRVGSIAALTQDMGTDTPSPSDSVVGGVAASDDALKSVRQDATLICNPALLIRNDNISSTSIPSSAFKGLNGMPSLLVSVGPDEHDSGLTLNITTVTKSDSGATARGELHPVVQNGQTIVEFVNPHPGQPWTGKAIAILFTPDTGGR